MASCEVEYCTNYPNFAVICSFIEKFGELLTYDFPNILELQTALEKTDEGMFSNIDFNVIVLNLKISK